MQFKKAFLYKKLHFRVTLMMQTKGYEGLTLKLSYQF